jgi:glycosyltransferase involved in cell wall biosynthesis
MSLKVSIIIPSYNQAFYILNALKSALSQTYLNKEIIIADDHSTDDSYSKIMPFLSHPNLHYFRNLSNIGRVKNYHKALYEYASGDLALVLDGDDFLIDNNYISEAVELFEQNPGMILVMAKHKTLFDLDNTLISDGMTHPLKPVSDGNELFINYWKGISIPHLTSLYKRQYALEIGYYVEDIQSTDWESVLRLILGHKVGFINKFVAVWRKHGHNASRAIEEVLVAGNLKYIENAYHFASKKNLFPIKSLKKWRFQMLKRYFFRVLVEANFHSPELINAIWKIMENHSIEVYQSMRFDYKYLTFKILILFKPALYFVTKYIQKQESMYKDLQSFAKRKS